MADYFGMPPIVSIILLIIPFTSWVCGFVARLQDGKYVAAIIRIFFGCWIIWVGDIINTAINGCNVNILRLIPI